MYFSVYRIGVGVFSPITYYTGTNINTFKAIPIINNIDNLIANLLILLKQVHQVQFHYTTD